jgi:hypothetical protein
MPISRFKLQLNSQYGGHQIMFPGHKLSIASNLRPYCQVIIYINVGFCLHRVSRNMIDRDKLRDISASTRASGILFSRNRP